MAKKFKKDKSPYVSNTGVYEKVTCKKCGSKFCQDDNESLCCFCSQSKNEEADVIRLRKERERMKRNGI